MNNEKCYNCGETQKRNDLFIYGEYYYCENCYNELFFTCACCNEVAETENGFIVEATQERICTQCYDDCYDTCQNCCCVIHSTDVVWFDECPYCEDCYDEVLKDLGLHHYNYKPDELFFYSNEEKESTDRNKVPYVGIELEIQGMERNHFCRNMVKKYKNEMFYLKEDGSISDKEGVEIVSMPMTYNYIINELDSWRNVFDNLHYYDMNNVFNCGLHFHIDRTYCNKPSFAATIDYIVNHFSTYFVEIGGRDFNDNYCKKIDKSNEDWGTRNFNRYCAVNLENQNTIELRFCKATDDWQTFANRVKMCFGIIYFAKKFSLKDIASWNKSQFIRNFNNICKKHFGSIVQRNLGE